MIIESGFVQSNKSNGIRFAMLVGLVTVNKPVAVSETDLCRFWLQLQDIFNLHKLLGGAERVPHPIG